MLDIRWLAILYIAALAAVALWATRPEPVYPDRPVMTVRTHLLDAIERKPITLYRNSLPLANARTRFAMLVVQSDRLSL